MENATLSLSFKTQVIFKMHHLVFAMDRYADAELQQKGNLSYSTYLFLMMISKHSGCSQKMLAQCLGYTQAAISKHVSYLLLQKFIVQTQNPENRRENNITLTTLGKEKLTFADNIIHELTAILTKKIPDQELQTLNNSLNSLLALFQEPS